MPVFICNIWLSSYQLSSTWKPRSVLCPQGRLGKHRGILKKSAQKMVFMNYFKMRFFHSIKKKTTQVLKRCTHPELDLLYHISPEMCQEWFLSADQDLSSEHGWVWREEGKEEGRRKEDGKEKRRTGERMKRPVDCLNILYMHI